MKQYITQEQARELWQKIADCKLHDAMPGTITERDKKLHLLCNATIQAYRDRLTAGVVLPEPVHHIMVDGVLIGYFSKNQLRQAIADAAAKQVPLTDKQIDTLPISAVTVKDAINDVRIIEAVHGITSDAKA